MSLKFVILFNGPPRTGKDTASDFLLGELPNSVMIKFTEPVKNMTHKRLGLDVSHGHYEELKDTKLVEFGNKTPRECYIETSLALREKNGENAVAKLFTESVLSTDAEVIINPDIGYDFEAEELLGVVDISKVLLFKVTRDCKSFDDDCRDWLTVDQKYSELKTIHIHNHDKAEFLQAVLGHVNEFVNMNSLNLINH